MRKLRKRLKRLALRRRDVFVLVVGIALALGGVKLVSFFYSLQTPVPYQSAGITATWIPPTVKHWSSAIVSTAKQYNLDPNLVAIIMTMESGGNPTAVSYDGAVGLLQVTPPTAQDIAAHYLKKPVTRYDLYNPTTNIEFGVAYLAHLRSLFGAANQGPDWDSTVELIAAGYNGGPGAAENLAEGNGLDDIQTASYASDVSNMWRERHASDSPTFDRWSERGGNTLVASAQAEQN